MDKNRILFVCQGNICRSPLGEGILRKQAAERGLIGKMPAVHAIGTSEYPTPAKRPAYSVLDNSRFAQTFGQVLPQWQAGLSRTLDALVTTKD